MDKEIKLLEGKEIAQKISQKIQLELSGLIEKPRLDIFLIGNNPSSVKYVDLKTAKASEVGINVVVHKYDESLPQESLITEIGDLNHNSEITGIMVQLPLPISYDTNKILNTINPEKDVDGLTAINLGKAFANQKDAILSATSSAIKEIIEANMITVKGKDVVILGTSVEVGLPTAAYFFCNGATVQLCNIDTINVLEKAKCADILICATGKPKFVTSDFVKTGAVVIDVGYTLVDGKVVGDVDFESVKSVASAISPVPGGVGPVTVTCLLQNTFNAYKNQKDV